jgi:glucose/arabinose dehydrogenase
VPPPPNPNAPPPKGEQDWKKDQPGRRHRIDLAKLPAPFDTPSSAKFPRLVDKPADAVLKVPAGFKVEVFAKDLNGARNMRIAPNGDVFLAQTMSNKITVLRPSADGSKAEKIITFAQGLNLPFGMAFVPADNPKWLYVAEMNRVVRYAYKVGQSVAAGVPEVVVPELYPSKASGHYTRDLGFSLDGKRMYVSVGSESNVAEQIPKKSAAEVQAFEKDAMTGAAWGSETNRAAVLVFDAANPGKPRLYATGIRNCVALTVQPVKGDVWCTTNERDMLGDDLVPDYSTRVKDGQFYGWPWYYMGNREDPRHAGERPDLNGKVATPDVPYQAHSAAVALQFYTATSGKSVFPKEYLGDGFAVLHGSWNRAFRTGHKIVRVLMKDGVPTGEYEDFLTGFIVNDGDAWGRPVSNVVAKDGSMLLSDDGANIVYRISTTR